MYLSPLPNTERMGSRIQTQIDWSQYLSVVACKSNSLNNIALTNLFSDKLRKHLFSLEKSELKSFLNKMIEVNKTTNDINQSLQIIESKI